MTKSKTYYKDYIIVKNSKIAAQIQQMSNKIDQWYRWEKNPTKKEANSHSISSIKAQINNSGRKTTRHQIRLILKQNNND